MKTLAAIALLALGITIWSSETEAKAGFILNYTRWQALASSQQSAYVAGWLDHAMTVGEPGTVGLAISLGLISCSARAPLDAELVASQVTATYQQFPETWDKSASVILVYVTNRICQSDINRVLASLGRPERVDAAQILAAISQ